MCSPCKLGGEIGYNIGVFYYFYTVLFSKLYRNIGLGFPEVVVGNGGEGGAVKQTACYPLLWIVSFREKVLKIAPLPSDTGAKKKGIYPRCSFSTTITENIFIPLDPSSPLPLGDARPTPLLRTILC